MENNIRRTLWKISLVILTIFIFRDEGEVGVNGQSFPLVFLVDRDWRIPEDEPVGTRVARVRVSQESAHLNVSFELESSGSGGGGEDFSKLFKIDSKTGAVFLNQNVTGRKGSEGFLYVTGSSSDSEGPSTKAEVRVQIIGAGENPHTQQDSMRFGGGGAGFNVPKFNRPGGGGLFPGGGGGGFPSGFPTPPTVPPTSSTVQDVTSIRPITDATGATPTASSTSTELPASSVDSTTTEISVPYNVTSGGSMDEEGTTDLENKGDGGSGGNSSGLVSTGIPVVLICALLILAAGVYLVRKRKKLTKQAKAARPVKEMRKESGVSVTSAEEENDDDEEIGGGRLPSALTSWVGKRAESNRYEEETTTWDGAVGAGRWEYPRHQLKIIGILGEGCFGQVWRCEAKDIDGKEGLTTVAVKTLKESAGERERADLVSELAVMKSLDTHPNVVRLIACCTEKDPLFVIMEWVSLGKLQSFLRGSRAEHYYGNLHADSNSLSSKDLTRFAYQVAKGMEYLASKGIIHRDLAARNILIDELRVCKVADFGFARDVVDNHVYERKSDGRLPIRWMAPEALYDNIFTTKTDVWSFGVLMWEIVTLGSTPYPGLGAGEVMRKVRDGYRLEKPEHCKRDLYNIMFYCWAHEAEGRPGFSDLVNFLGRLLFSDMDYIEMDRFPEHNYYNMTTDSIQNLDSVVGEKL